MINVVDDLLAEVLRKEFGTAFAPAEMPEVVFAHPTAVPEKAPPTLSLYLYEIRENTALRLDPFMVSRQLEGKTAAKGRSPMRFDLTYAVSGHADDPRAEHALLTFALGAFLRNPVVEMPKAEGQEEAEKMSIAIAQPEHDAPQALVPPGTRPTPSVTLRVTAPFNPFDARTVPLVRQAIIGYGQGSTPGFLGHPIDVKAVSLSAAGVVTGEGGRPMPDVLVSVADRLTRTTTDAEGRYILLNLPPGKYELVFEKRGFATVHHDYEVPLIGRVHEIEELDVAMEALDHDAAIAALQGPRTAFSHLLQTDLSERKSVVGRLRYPDQSPAAFVPVMLGNQSTVTDSQGVYAFSQAPFGTALIAEIPGQGRVEVRDGTVAKAGEEEAETPVKPRATRAAAKEAPASAHNR